MTPNGSATTRRAARLSASRARSDSTPRAGLVVGALLIVYVVWGSTYLGIRVVVEEAPPLVSMGVRYVSAAVMLAAILAVRGGVRRLAVNTRQLLGACFLGLMLPLLGNGMVSVGESRGVPSGVTALLIAATPLWIVVYRTIAQDRPRGPTLFGVLLGFVGLAFLVLVGGRGDASAGVAGIPVGPAALIVFAAAAWGLGSFLQPRLWLPEDVFVTTVYEMLSGGLFLLLVGWGVGERFTGDYSMRTWVALGYLVVFGSVVAFTAYVWLVAHAPITLVSTYAYVNPVVAVVLGWLILSEAVTPAVVLGGGIVVVAVAIVVRSERPRRRAVRPGDTTEPAAG